MHGRSQLPTLPTAPEAFWAWIGRYGDMGSGMMEGHMYQELLLRNIIRTPGTRVQCRTIARGVRGTITLGPAVALWLVACATPYQPVNSMGGYSELPFSGDIVLVAFHWTRFTPRDRIQDFLLLRAAEVALDRGAPYFIVLDQSGGLQTDPLRGTVAIPYTTHPSAVRGAVGGPGESMVTEDPRTVKIRIQLLKDSPPSGPPIMDAQKLRADLRAKYGLGT